jgi:GST-like protein
MFDLYVAGSPAILKVAVMLEECGLPYKTIYISIGEGRQHSPEFRALSPNGKMPVLVDHEPTDRGAPLVVFESGAILVYLADKTGQFLSAQPRPRAEALQWLFWQAAGLSPFFGQAVHFIRHAPAEARPYGRLRYLGEVRRHLGVLDKHLEGRDFIAGDYSVADMGAYPWVNLSDQLRVPVSDYPNVERWWKSIGGRPAVKRAYDRVMTARPESAPVPPEEFNRNMFGEAAAQAMAKT